MTDNNNIIDGKAFAETLRRQIAIADYAMPDA